MPFDGQIHLEYDMASTNLNDTLRDEIQNFDRDFEENPDDGETDSTLDVLRSAFK